MLVELAVEVHILAQKSEFKVKAELLKLLGKNSLENSK